MITLDIDLTDDIDSAFYLKTLITLAKGDDGKIDEKELAFIRAQADVFSEDISSYMEDGEHSVDLAKSIAPPSRETALAIVRDGIALGYINGNFTTEQRQVLYEIAPALGLVRADVDEMEDWLKELWVVLEKGNALLRGQQVHEHK